MKRRILLLLCMAGLISVGVYADHPKDMVGVGLFMGGGWASVGGGLFHPGVTIKAPTMPFFWGFNASFGKASGLGVSMDYYLLDRDLVKDGSIDLDWFLGVGGFTHLYFGSDFTLALGFRLPIGLSWHISNSLELFLDVTPGIGARFDSEPFYTTLGGELGLRVWF